MTYKEIINKVAEDLNMPSETVDRTYKAFWLFIRDSLQELPLKEDLTEEEFSILKPNFNIPSLGKISCTYNRYKGVKEKFNYIKKLRKRHEEAT